MTLSGPGKNSKLNPAEACRGEAWGPSAENDTMSLQPFLSPTFEIDGESSYRP